MIIKNIFIIIIIMMTKVSREDWQTVTVAVAPSTVSIRCLVQYHHNHHHHHHYHTISSLSRETTKSIEYGRVTFLCHTDRQLLSYKNRHRPVDDAFFPVLWTGRLRWSVVFASFPSLESGRTCSRPPS